MQTEFHTYDFARHFVSACTRILGLEGTHEGVEDRGKLTCVAAVKILISKCVDEILKIDVKPGRKKSTKITFIGKGNQEAGKVPADLILVVDEKLHALFKREEHYLVVTEKILLVDALTGKTLNLTALDGRNLKIKVTDIVKQGSNSWCRMKVYRFQRLSKAQISKSPSIFLSFSSCIFFFLAFQYLL
ncbi:hypothetical protein Ahy_A10g049450 isoform A [Arachis hypogaea]|uniref:Chaperone DnaJ C-terminal domain-containing protein n=1 Tax=Arachis hypogaea TaxID=3818 RepID=A0A445B757_ARAHY|nr:hypothetical protein Ahy_A10g049450 isoform A [Arachis hypogaea]